MSLSSPSSATGLSHAAALLPIPASPLAAATAAAAAAASTAALPPPPPQAGSPALSNKRRQGLSLSCPIVYGNLAEVPDESHTHRWTVYVRGADGDDISYVVKKVVFKLHDSYAESLRTVEQPPYEVSETGWGEFEVQIKVFFRDAVEKPVTIFHHLALYPHAATLQPSKKLLVFEQYDEIVFNDPSDKLYQMLMRKERIPGFKKTAPFRDYSEFEVAQLEQLKESKDQVRAEMAKQKAKYRDLDEEAQVLKREIAALEQELNIDATAMELV
ncbi:hypothetical protein CAOG_004591 [Capsaspora owczarzaki ATCC 30864]|uniref:YEATS domain-containing protein n=1 Tax=Capsaspora owczarzaki (strain ATCC 30864) TaxID=595528 RepID=A0A0D2X385_CAPO3|nr:hypothetical protein CAOG_004591 [Capsaspora owczarzaki ATCC 30864]